MWPVRRAAACRTAATSDDESSGSKRASGSVTPVAPTTSSKAPKTGAAIATPPSIRSPWVIAKPCCRITSSRSRRCGGSVGVRRSHAAAAWTEQTRADVLGEEGEDREPARAGVQREPLVRGKGVPQRMRRLDGEGEHHLPALVAVDPEEGGLPRSLRQVPQRLHRHLVQREAIGRRPGEPEELQAQPVGAVRRAAHQPERLEIGEQPVRRARADPQLTGELADAVPVLIAVDHGGEQLDAAGERVASPHGFALVRLPVHPSSAPPADGARVGPCSGERNSSAATEAGRPSSGSPSWKILRSSTL